MNGILKSISVLVITILLQIGVFRFGIFAGGNAIIFFHLYGIVLLPIGWHKTTYLFCKDGKRASCNNGAIDKKLWSDRTIKRWSSVDC